MPVKQQNKNGFSLIELLVVISIIGVLSAVLTANFVGMRERARDAQKIQDLNSMKTALRSYYNDHQGYPAKDSLLTAIGTSNYMPSLKDISFPYNYEPSVDGESFYITADLEAGAGSDDTNSLINCGIGTTKDKFFAVCAK